MAGCDLGGWVLHCRRKTSCIILLMPPGNLILLMEKILHQLIGSLSYYLQGFSTIPGGDRRISEPSTVWRCPKVLGSLTFHPWFFIDGYSSKRPPAIDFFFGALGFPSCKRKKHTQNQRFFDVKEEGKLIDHVVKYIYII